MLILSFLIDALAWTGLLYGLLRVMGYAIVKENPYEEIKE